MNSRGDPGMPGGLVSIGAIVIGVELAKVWELVPSPVPHI